jgi:hypothetical protein
VQELIGSASKPRAVLVCLDDIQRRLEIEGVSLAPHPPSCEANAETDAGTDDPQLMAWREARGKNHCECRMRLNMLHRLFRGMFFAVVRAAG